MRRQMWSPQEDEKLQQWLLKHGHAHGSWNEVANNAGLQRDGKSCRLRWNNYLRPGVRRGKFSLEEVEHVVKLQAMHGNRWSMIASLMEGRTENSVKNLWNSQIKRQMSKVNKNPSTNGLIQLSKLSNYSTHGNIEEQYFNNTSTNYDMLIRSKQSRTRMFPFDIDSDNIIGSSTLISSNGINIPELEAFQESTMSQMKLQIPTTRHSSFGSLNFNTNQDQEQEDGFLNHLLAWDNQQYYTNDMVGQNSEILMNDMLDEIMSSTMSYDHDQIANQKFQSPLRIDPPYTIISSMDIINFY